jgi:hypothetical protein
VGLYGVFPSDIPVSKPPPLAAVTHISQKSILWESIFDSFSLEGEAFGGNFHIVSYEGSLLDTGQRLLPPAGEKLSSIGSSEPMDD